MRYYLIVFFLWLLSCGKKTETTQPVQQSITESVYASGVVKSNGQYQVFANASGTIAKLLVTKGDQIKKGQTLALLSNNALRFNTESSKVSADFNSLQNNRAKLEEMRQNIDLARQKKDNDALLLSRQQNLWQQGIGTRVELDQRELSAKNSATAYQNALLQYDQLKKELHYAEAQSRANLRVTQAQENELEVKSDVSGRVYTIMKEQGEMITPQTPIAIIGEGDSFYMELQVDEYDIAKVQTGQKVFITMDSYKGKVFEGEISKIIPYMNDRTKTFTVEAVFNAPPDRLYPNLSVEANIMIITKNKALLIPRNYLLDDDHVILKNGEKRKVVAGIKDYQQVEIISGLTKNDVIIKPK